MSMIMSNNRRGKTRDLFKKIGDARMGMINDRNSKDLTEREEIKKRWQKYRRTGQKKSSGLR